MSEAVLAAARAAYAAGVCVVPPKEDGSKEPIGKWKKWQTERPGPDQMRAWYGERTGLGAVCGSVSGDLELLEFDDHDTYLAYTAAAEKAGLGDLVERIEGGWSEATPGGGVHWYTRCDEVAGNTKLARRPKAPEEMADPDDKVEVLIETRGEGGYAILAPSNGRVHPTGKAYRLLRGGPATIAAITPEERELLWELARSFDRMPRQEATGGVRVGQPDSDGWAARPGDAYAEAVDWPAILEPHGWTAVFTQAGETYWRRPGKVRGWSATTNHGGHDKLYVFTTNSEFDSERGYGKFSVYAILNHAGDFAAAARALHDRGYGRKAAPGGGGAVADERPVIDAGEGDLARLTATAWAALEGANDPPQFFRHADRVARVELDDAGAPTVRELTVDRMRHHLARTGRWRVRRVDKRTGEVRLVDVPPPTHAVKDVLATPDPPLPVLTRIVEVPVFGPKGELQTAVGYHPAGRTYYWPAAGLRLPAIPDRPTGAERERARRLILDDLLVDFVFDADADRAHAVALLLLPFVRDMIAGPTPGHMIEAPMPGSGKGLLADVLLFPALGDHVGKVTECDTEDEWRKRLSSQFRAGRAAVLLDNLSRPLNSAQVAAALTAELWEDRLLGGNDLLRVPVRCAWAITGNNVVVSTEIARRIARCRLDPKLERPWERDPKRFKHPRLREWAHDNRGALVGAALTLVRAWVVAGRPAWEERSLGSFEDWCRVVGGVLAHAGIDGFLANATDFYATADTEAGAWRAFIAGWWRLYGDKPQAAVDLRNVAARIDGFDLGASTELRAEVQRLGQLLRHKRGFICAVTVGRTVMTLRVARADDVHNAARWRLEELPPAASSEGG